MERCSALRIISSKFFIFEIIFFVKLRWCSWYCDWATGWQCEESRFGSLHGQEIYPPKFPHLVLWPMQSYTGQVTELFQEVRQLERKGGHSSPSSSFDANNEWANNATLVNVYSLCQKKKRMLCLIILRVIKVLESLLWYVRYYSSLFLRK